LKKITLRQKSHQRKQTIFPQSKFEFLRTCPGFIFPAPIPFAIIQSTTFEEEGIRAGTKEEFSFGKTLNFEEP
jgi:hypothetical protein